MAGNVDSWQPQKNPSATYDAQVLFGTIPVGGTVSNTFDLSGWTLAALETPGTLAAGTVSIYAANNAQGPYRPYYDQTGVAVKGTVIQGNQIVGFGTLAPLRYIQLVTAGTGQTAGQAVNLIVK